MYFKYLNQTKTSNHLVKILIGVLMNCHINNCSQLLYVNWRVTLNNPGNVPTSLFRYFFLWDIENIWSIYIFINSDTSYLIGQIETSWSTLDASNAAEIPYDLYPTCARRWRQLWDDFGDDASKTWIYGGRSCSFFQWFLQLVLQIDVNNVIVEISERVFFFFLYFVYHKKYFSTLKTTRRRRLIANSKS